MRISGHQVIRESGDVKRRQRPVTNTQPLASAEYKALASASFPFHHCTADPGLLSRGTGGTGNAAHSYMLCL